MPTPVQIERRREWHAALESGRYEQGKGRLRADRDVFCCLGVACDLYHDQTGHGEWVSDGSSWYFVPDEGGTREDLLPQEVMEWFGFTASAGELVVTVTGESHYTDLNDSGNYPFYAIADIDRKIIGDYDFDQWVAFDRPKAYPG